MSLSGRSSDSDANHEAEQWLGNEAEQWLTAGSAEQQQEMLA